MLGSIIGENIGSRSEDYHSRIKRTDFELFDKGSKFTAAQAVSAAIFMARHHASKAEIKSYIVQNFHYDLGHAIEGIRPNYSFDCSCECSVPEAIMAFMDGSDYENTIRLAVSRGGDSDTQACIAGGY
jgi:ADP-ribosylglycohydrolase